jgi:septal ring-binding cell division protein DamX
MAETPVEIRVDVNANEAEDTRAEAGELAETGAAEIAGESLGGESDPAPEMADTAAAELAVASEPVLSATEEFISQATSDEARSDSPASDPVAAVSETSPVTESPTVESAAPAQPASDAQRLQRDLQASLDWLSTRDDGIGTLQILLLSQSRFDSRAYYEHIDRLTSQGIDGSQLRILPTNTGNREVFSVVYGEYTSRSAAADARPGLPEVLRKDSPIVRSVGGLKEEIRRLDAQN